MNLDMPAAAIYVSALHRDQMQARRTRALYAATALVAAGLWVAARLLIGGTP